MVEVKPYIKLFNSTHTEPFNNDFNFFLQTDNKLLKNIFTNFKFEPSKEVDNEIKELSKIIKIDSNQLEMIVRAGNVIFTRCAEEKITLDELRIDFENMGFKKEIFERVKTLYDDFGKNYAINRLKYEIIKSNLYALSPKLTNILYNLNIRAIEKTTDEKHEIIGQIPVAHIEFEANVESKGLRGAFGIDTKKFDFNATVDDLEKLIDDLNKIKLKLSILIK